MRAAILIAAVLAACINGEQVSEAKETGLSRCLLFMEAVV